MRLLDGSRILETRRKQGDDGIHTVMNAIER
jgi:hypothetical protein